MSSGFGTAAVSSRSAPPLLASAADFVAAIDHVKGACHVIVAPPVARGAAEHGLADWRGAAIPARSVRAVAAGPPPELEQVPAQRERC